MAGAFGALGGDISVLNQNPAGIGVYRSSDISATIDLNFQSSKVDGMSNADTQTKFTFNNVGYVGALKLNSDVMPNLNVGFSYTRTKSFHRHYRGADNNIPSSVTNYIAALTNSGNWSEDDLAFGYDGHPQGANYDPYYDSNAPWLSILSYDSYLLNPGTNGFEGITQNGTTGYGEFEVDESGHTDEYSINLGGNIKNTVYWGLGVGIVDLKYDSYMYYGEALNNAYYYHPDFDASGNMLYTGRYTSGEADFGFVNHLATKGTGYNFKFGEEGKVQKLMPVLRYEHFTKDAAIENGGTNWYTVGINYWPVTSLNFKLDYSLVQKETGTNSHRVVGILSYKF